jgi:hypothetical protein
MRMLGRHRGGEVFDQHEVRASRKHGFEQDPRFEPGQRRAEAVMNTVPEREVGEALPAHVELIHVVEAPAVTVGRQDGDQDGGPSRNHLPALRDILGRDAMGAQLHRAVVSEDLLDSAGQ